MILEMMSMWAYKIHAVNAVTSPVECRENFPEQKFTENFFFYFTDRDVAFSVLKAFLRINVSDAFLFFKSCLSFGIYF